MAYIKKDDGTFEVKGTKNNWIVSERITSCNCPKFKFILKGQGECHHMLEVKLGEAKVSQAIEQATGVDKYPTFERSKYLEPIMLHKFIEVFGESQYRVLSTTSIIFTHRGLVRLI